VGFKMRICDMCKEEISKDRYGIETQIKIFMSGDLGRISNRLHGDRGSEFCSVECAITWLTEFKALTTSTVNHNC